MCALLPELIARMLSRLQIAGVSHRSVGAAQLVHLIPDAIGAEQLQALLSHDGTPAVLLVTCNRVECVWIGDSSRPVKILTEWVTSRARSLVAPLATGAIVSRSGERAIRHLVRVTAGLESQLQGDSDILGQVRQSWMAARRAGQSSPSLDRVFERVVNATRRIRQHAEFDDASRTIGRAAADVLDERLGHAWNDRHVLVLGSGAAATSALDALTRLAPLSLRISSRTDARAADVARKRGCVQAVSWNDRTSAIASSDVVVFALRAEQPVVMPEDMPTLLHHRTRHTTWADLGMPPNVHSAIVHPTLDVLSLDALMTSRSLEDASHQRAEVALERECALLTALFDRRPDAPRALLAG